MRLVTSYAFLLTLLTSCLGRDFFIKEKSEIEKISNDALEEIIYEIPYKAPKTPVRAL